jgi:transcription elongation GreA/GreB family factor
MDVSKTTKIAHLGSLIYTDTSTYFLSVSAGKLTVGNAAYFAISISSPIGKLLLGKKENDVISFQENSFKILEIY